MIVDAEARNGERPPPDIAVWVTVAQDPGAGTLAQMAAQIAVYLRPPGYGEMFTELGFGYLVDRLRDALLDGSLALHWGDAVAVIVALALFVAGRWVFLRLSPHFEDFV